MKAKRRQKKEIFSVLIVSHINNYNRQFQLSATFLRLCVTGLVLVCGILGFMGYYLFTGSSREYELKRQIDEQAKQIQALEKENELLNTEHQALLEESDLLRKQEEQQLAEAEEETSNTTHPRFYPSDGVGELQSFFSEEQPFLSIGVRKGDNIVVTGDGVVKAVDYHSDYAHSIEVEHSDGYISRYLYDSDVTIQVEEGEAVQARDPLFTIVSNNTQLDYQIIHEGEPINPFQVMKSEDLILSKEE